LCLVRGLSLFRPFEGEALARLNRLRAGTLAVSAGMPICAPGFDDGHVYTVFRGWAFSYRMRDDGRRQILDFHLAGDLLGSERLATASPDVGLEALTPVLLCAFRRDALLAAADDMPAFGSALSWMTSREGAVLSERLVTLGRRRASERVAHMILELWTRTRCRGRLCLPADAASSRRRPWPDAGACEPGDRGIARGRAGYAGRPAAWRAGPRTAGGFRGLDQHLPRPPSLVLTLCAYSWVGVLTLGRIDPDHFPIFWIRSTDARMTRGLLAPDQSVPIPRAYISPVTQISALGVLCGLETVRWQVPGQ
jgi:CRP-like cAMP-binding protein